MGPRTRRDGSHGVGSYESGIEDLHAELHRDAQEVTMRRLRLQTVVLSIAGLIVAITVFSQTPSQAPAQAPAPNRPRLILVLSIDQMRFDYLTRFAPLYKGGLKTLLDRGAVFTDANYRHSATETGPGHSVILTGRHPSHSGIVANDWYDAYQ